MNSTQILKHCKYFIDLFEEIHQQSNVPFSSCTSGTPSCEIEVHFSQRPDQPAGEKN